MLTDEVKQQIRNFYNLVSQSVPDFKSRAGQREMIGQIAKTLSNARTEENEVTDGSNIVLVEGRTGVGKTVGYLIPSIAVARQLKKKLVISSATVALQEQLMVKDIPTILAALKEPIKVVLAKGRGRYVCATRLAKMSGEASQNNLFEDAVWERPPSASEISHLSELLRLLDSGKWNGDRDELSDAITEDVWSRITNDSHSCIGRRCEGYQKCAYYIARKNIEDADIIVANHDLVLSALASDSTLLPPPGDTLYVFDEAHHLPDVAVSRFAAKHGLKGSAKWLERLPTLTQHVQSVIGSSDVCRATAGVAHDLASRLTELLHSLEHSVAFADNKCMRFKHGELTAEFKVVAENISKLSQSTNSGVLGIREAIEESRKSNLHLSTMLDNLVSELGFFIGRTDNLMKVWEMMLRDKIDGLPGAKWIEKDKFDFHVCVSPISASHILRNNLWERASGVVMTSATITALGDFKFFIRNAGLSKYSGVATLSIQSPFDFERQGEIIVPFLRADPSNADAHTKEISDVLPGLLVGYQGSMVLFASRRQMEQVYEMIPQDTREMVLMQGIKSRTQILVDHHDRIMSGISSVIFGLASFGEGVDLPGKLCEQVIISKIPFSPPDTPLEQALAEWIEKNDGKPFFEISLPKAGLHLVQWVGRLIRTESDRGRVVFLDTRIVGKSYGKMLIKGFPPMPVRRQRKAA